MKRITISLPDDLADVLMDDARRRRRSVSELVREAISREFGMDEECARRDIPFAALGAGDRTDVGARFDEYLKEAWNRELMEPRRNGD